jgi:hypothetical protein
MLRDNIQKTAHNFGMNMCRPDTEAQYTSKLQKISNIQIYPGTIESDFLEVASYILNLLEFVDRGLGAVGVGAIIGQEFTEIVVERRHAASLNPIFSEVASP